MATRTTCRLCTQSKPLCRSHLLPKALYKALRLGGSDENPNPLIITQTPTDASAMATSRQAVQPLLCQTCENVLSAPGEKYALAQCLKLDGTFPLRDVLQRTTP